MEGPGRLEIFLMATPVFRAGGLASGIDTNSIIDQLVTIESRPLTILKAKQSALKSQVSLLGDVASKLSALRDAAKALKSDGALSVVATTGQTGFSVAAGAGAQAGRYGIQVTALASEAKARSVGFAGDDAAVQAGTLNLNVMGTSYDVTINDGDSVADVAAAINASAAPVSATLISDGTQTYLSISNDETGFPVGGVAGDALLITENYNGGAGQSLGLAMTSTAANAHFTVDGLPIERQSNEVSDVIQGVSFSLKALTAAPENVVLTSNVDGTAEKLQTFITAYNDVASLVQKQLAVTDGSNRQSTLAGDGTVRGLQQSLQRLVTTAVDGLGSVRTLADIGVKTGRDGSLSLDKNVLKTAVAREPAALNGLFSQAATGMGDVASQMVDRFTNSTDGTLVLRQRGLNGAVDRLDDDQLRAQARIDAFRDRIVKQFTAMEKVVGSLNSISNFLSQNLSSNKQSNS